MQFLVIGDLHGRAKDFIRIDRYAYSRGIGLIVQVGDLGVYWPKDDNSIIKYLQKSARRPNSQPTWLTCLGNHDNWNKYDDKRNTFDSYELPTLAYAHRLCAVKRASIYSHFPSTDKMLFMGGAVSSDTAPGVDMFGQRWPGRKVNVDWWAQEAPAQEDFEAFLSLLEAEQPQYVFTHDGPKDVTHSNDERLNPLSGLPVNYVAHQLQQCWNLSTYKPPLWFYGHHHNSKTHSKTQTTFACSGLHGQGWYVNGTVIRFIDFNKPFKEIDLLTNLIQIRNA